MKLIIVNQINNVTNNLRSVDYTMIFTVELCL